MDSQVVHKKVDTTHTNLFAQSLQKVLEVDVVDGTLLMVHLLNLVVCRDCANHGAVWFVDVDLVDLDILVLTAVGFCLQCLFCENRLVQKNDFAFCAFWS